MLTDIQFNIMIPYRPCCMGYRKSPLGELRQQENGDWLEVEKNIIHNEGKEYEKKIVSLRTSIAALNARSRFKHKVMVIIDNDVFPNSQFMKQFDNVTIIKCNYKVPNSKDIKTYENIGSRLAYAMQAGIDAALDDEWIIYGWAADTLPSIDWDFHVMESINRHGEDKVYTPMYIEGTQSNHPNSIGITLTHEWIWKQRDGASNARGVLLFPDPRPDYFELKDFDHFVEVARQANKGDQIENCGDRNYGHASTMIMKSKYIKKTGVQFGNWDEAGFIVDNFLYITCKLQKVILTNAFILHPMCWHLEMRLPY